MGILTVNAFIILEPRPSHMSTSTLLAVPVLIKNMPVRVPSLFLLPMFHIPVHNFDTPY